MCFSQYPEGFVDIFDKSLSEASRLLGAAMRETSLEVNKNRAASLAALALGHDCYAK